MRTRTGCGSCRARRKKCDEGKPSCQACVRLNLKCSYQLNQNIRHLEVPASPSDHVNQLTVTRVADHNTPQASTSAGRVFEILGATKVSYQNASLDPHRSVERLLIEGVRNGWQKLLNETWKDLSLTQDQCRLMSSLDQYFHDIGHGQVARIVFGWHYYHLSQVG